MADVSAEIMERNHLSGSDVSWLVPHQANKRIIDATANRMGIESDKVMLNIQQVRQYYSSYHSALFIRLRIPAKKRRQSGFGGFRRWIYLGGCLRKVGVLIFIYRVRITICRALDISSEKS